MYEVSIIDVPTIYEAAGFVVVDGLVQFYADYDGGAVVFAVQASRVISISRLVEATA